MGGVLYKVAPGSTNRNGGPITAKTVNGQLEITNPSFGESTLYTSFSDFQEKNKDYFSGVLFEVTADDPKP